MSKRNLIIAFSVCLLVVATVANAQLKPIKEVNGNSVTSSMATTSTPLIVVCIQKAVETRDNAIISALDSYYTSAKSALETRRDGLKNAWAISGAKERKTAIKQVWADFTKAQRDAKKNLQKAKIAAWKQFRIDRKVCGRQAISDDSAGEGTDSQL